MAEEHLLQGSDTRVEIFPAGQGATPGAGVTPIVLATARWGMERDNAPVDLITTKYGRVRRRGMVDWTGDADGLLEMDINPLVEIDDSGVVDLRLYPDYARWPTSYWVVTVMIGTIGIDTEGPEGDGQTWTFDWSLASGVPTPPVIPPPAP